jgi:hypothetical protein
MTVLILRSQAIAQIQRPKKVEAFMLKTLTWYENYFINLLKEPMSIIRQDDVEVYMRQVAYDQKVNRLMSKFLARLKWLPLYRRFEIWTDAVEAYNKIKEANLSR